MTWSNSILGSLLLPSSVDATTRRFLGRALRLASKGRYRVAPNPRVGAVIVRDGIVVGEGYHAQVGGPHAEVEALGRAGGSAQGATLYVTLEPCSHHGRTPPCADAVIAAGIQRVVACHRDPNPQVAGQGFRQLREAGLRVDVGPLAEEAVELNLPFLVSHLLARPAVTLKWAMSLDGRIATASGESQWISSPGARRSGLALREDHDAILVGIGTALADDPRLNRRLGLAQGPNLRVVLDRQLRLSPQARMLQEEGEVLVYAETSQEARTRALTQAGATVVCLPSVEPCAVLSDLAGRGVQSLLVEGGGAIHAAFVEQGCYDSIFVDCAPLLLGGSEAPGPLGGAGTGALAQAPRVEGLTAHRRDGDLLLTGTRQGCLQDLLRKLVD